MDELESGQSLAAIVEEIRTGLTGINSLRDATLTRSRALIRACAESIRAIHRHEWDEATAMLAAARAAANEMVDALADHPMLYHAGYTQDALKELVEAHLLFAVVLGGPMPQPAALRVTGATYLRGMSEAATEMRRFVLDLMRQGEIAQAEPYLAFMDEVYSQLITVDFPDSITDGLRRHTDVLRSVLERTRGDLTISFRQEQMRIALRSLEARLGTEFDAREEPIVDDEAEA
ncbi:MAG: haloacid dehalogenase [Caldilineaceae bacterium]|nr:haloacid dehalogenase [Caldilineaceae bacterium]